MYKRSMAQHENTNHKKSMRVCDFSPFYKPIISVSTHSHTIHVSTGNTGVNDYCWSSHQSVQDVFDNTRVAKHGHMIDFGQLQQGHIFAQLLGHVWPVGAGA